MTATELTGGAPTVGFGWSRSLRDARKVARDERRGGVLRLPSWPLNVWVAAATVAQRAGVATAAP